jgi:hypothetical protein
MPEEVEVPIEHFYEQVGHLAQSSSERWVILVAMSTALFAVIAAISSLLAGHHTHAALIEQIQASNNWAFYQARSIKVTMLETKNELLAGLGKEVSENDLAKLETYMEEQENIKSEAKKKTTSSSMHLQHYFTLAKSVTLYHIAIALGAISALTKRKALWFISMAVGATGILFLVIGIL